MTRFLEPCQIKALWFVRPEVQVLIVTHFEDVEDLAIDVYGPCACIQVRRNSDESCRKGLMGQEACAYAGNSYSKP